MADFIVKHWMNGKPVFVIHFEPGPEWRKRFYRKDQVVDYVECTEDLRDLTLDRLYHMQDRMPGASLQQIIDKFKIDREFQCLTPLPRKPTKR